jgi:flagellar assembly protein FliH
MSSKLLRGAAVAAEAPAWRRVSSCESVPEQPSSYISEPASKAASDAAELEQRVAAAHKKGFEEGQAAARQSASAQFEAVQIQLARSIENLTGLRARSRREAEQDVVALALAVARRILHRELTVSPEALLGVLKAALEKMEAREVYQVRVARADAALVKRFFDEMGAPQRVEIAADASLASGSVLIESDRGTLDASVETQLAEIERGFADLVRAS